MFCREVPDENPRVSGKNFGFLNHNYIVEALKSKSCIYYGVLATPISAVYVLGGGATFTSLSAKILKLHSDLWRLVIWIEYC